MTQYGKESYPRIPAEAILTWRDLQKKNLYPVNAFGERIYPQDYHAIHEWQKYGIDHYLDRIALKVFETERYRLLKQRPVRSGVFSRKVLMAFLLPLAVVADGIVCRPALSRATVPLNTDVYARIFVGALKSQLPFPAKEVDAAEGLWQFPTLALVNHLSQRELDLYERHQNLRPVFQEISELTGLQAHYFAALFYAESDLQHLVKVGDDVRLILSPTNAMGISQMTRTAMRQLDQEIAFYKKVIELREQIQKSYMISGNLKYVESLAKEVGGTFVLSTLAESGYDNVAGSDDLALKYNKDPLHLNFRGLTSSEDLCLEVARRLDILKILVGDSVDRDKFNKDGKYAARVGAAYFYLDYLALQSAFPEYDDSTILEMCVNSYNAGRGAMLRLISRYETSWRKHRFGETQIHWNRFSKALVTLQTIEQKLQLPQPLKEDFAANN